MSQTSSGKSVMVQGRLVWVSGDLFKGKPKLDHNTRQPKLDNQGNQIMEYGFGLAVPKSVLSQAGAGQPGEIWNAIHEEAYGIYPSRQVPPAFAWKYKDGDGVDHNGAPFANREGHAGHLIFACTTTIPIKFFRFENGINSLVNEGIKCGDYVNVQLTIKAHGPVGQGKPGLYLNPMAVQLVGYGKEIINMPSGDQIFGNQAPPVPMGASATPLAPTQGMLVPPGAAPVPQMPQPIAFPGQPMGAPAPTPQPGVQPHYGVVPQQFQPPQAQPGYPPPQAVGMPTPQQGFQPPGMPPYTGYPQR